MELNHLVSEGARIDALQPNQERIRQIQRDHWYSYPRADAVLAYMERLFQHARIDRMPNLQVIGESMSGKTRLLNRFAQELHQPVMDSRLAADYRPVVMFDAPVNASAQALLQEMLIAVHAPFPASANPTRLLAIVEKVYRRIETRVLIIDEIQHIVRGSGKQQRELRDQIKLIGNRLRISIVAAGIPEASNAFASDPQLSNRFHRLELKRWHINNQEDLKYAVAIIKSWQETCPLKKPSQLLQEAIIQRIFDETGGLFGHVIGYLKHASEYAIVSGDEHIHEGTLRKMGWRIPDEVDNKYFVA